MEPAESFFSIGLATTAMAPAPEPQQQELDVMESQTSLM